MERTHFIPGLDFEALAVNNQAIAAFQTLLVAIKHARWDVTKAEESIKDGLTGLMLTMNDGQSATPQSDS